MPFLTPVGPAPSEGGFFIQNGAEGAIPGWSLPDLNPTAWRLTIDGLVSNPLSLSLADLEAESGNAITIAKTMRCITDSNEFPGLIGTTLWTGIPLRTFLDRAGIDKTNTRRLRLYGTDNFTNNILLNDVYGTLAPGEFEPMLITHMDGAPLTREHGRPVRLLLYNGYGYKNVKWLTRIEATDSDEIFGTYQQVLGYVDDGIIRVSSKITDPVFNAELSAGTVIISGFAVSGFAPISKVDISIDGEAFQATRITPFDEVIVQAPDLAQAQQVVENQAFPYRSVWVKWNFRWDAEPGEHEIVIRATDAGGNTQPEEDFTFEDGLNAMPKITVRVV